MIIFDSVSKNYGSTIVLRDFCMAAGPGEIVGLVGANGSGKSTVLRIACGLRRPDSGRIHVRRNGQSETRVLGAALEGARPPENLSAYHVISRSFSYVFGRCATRKEVMNAAEAAAIIDVVHRRCGRFSTGQLKRLCLCVALIGDPSNLILDEPYNGLDADGSAWLSSELRMAASRGCTVLIAGHQIDPNILRFSGLFSLPQEGV